MKTRLLSTNYNLPERKLELAVETTIQGTVSRVILSYSQNDLFAKAGILGKTEWDFETIAVLIMDETGVMPSNMWDLYPVTETPVEETPIWE